MILQVIPVPQALRVPVAKALGMKVAMAQVLLHPGLQFFSGLMAKGLGFKHGYWELIGFSKQGFNGIKAARMDSWVSFQMAVLGLAFAGGL